MSDEMVTRINTIAAEMMRGEQVEVTANGENYYTVAGVGSDGRKSNFPPIWISPASSDQQIKDKLSLEFTQNLYPDSAPDDLSVPNLKNEGKQRDG